MLTKERKKKFSFVITHLGLARAERSPTPQPCGRRRCLPISLDADEPLVITAEDHRRPGRDEPLDPAASRPTPSSPHLLHRRRAALRHLVRRAASPCGDAEQWIAAMMAATLVSRLNTPQPAGALRCPSATSAVLASRLNPPAPSVSLPAAVSLFGRLTFPNSAAVAEANLAAVRRAASPCGDAEQWLAAMMAAMLVSRLNTPQPAGAPPMPIRPRIPSRQSSASRRSYSTTPPHASRPPTSLSSTPPAATRSSTLSTSTSAAARSTLI